MFAHTVITALQLFYLKCEECRFCYIICSWLYISVQSSLPYRDTVVEGLFSLSQLLPLVLEESKMEDDGAIVSDRKTLMFEPSHIH